LSNFLEMNVLKLFSLIIIILFSSCERKSGRKNIEKVNINHCFCQNDLCDYCVRVVGITDGDTFTGLTNKNEQIKYRIYGIDAPEKKQAYGARSTEYLSGLIFGQTVGIKVQTTDRWGRLIVWVFTTEGEDVSAEMLKAGMAWHFKRYDKTELYDILERDAKYNRIGLWQEVEPIAPWDFR
jgi:micrococcal nuclease